MKLHRILYFSLALIAIVIVYLVAKHSGQTIDFNSSDFYLNLITEIIGLLIAIIIVDLFGSRIFQYIENRKNKNFNLYLYKRLTVINNRLKQNFKLLSINTDNEYSNLEEFISSIDLSYINTQERRAIISGGQLISQLFSRPQLFFDELNQTITELEILSKQLPQGLTINLYEGFLMILSHDSLNWNIMRTPMKEFNSSWKDTFGELFFDKYVGVKKLIKAESELKKKLNLK